MAGCGERGDERTASSPRPASPPAAVGPTLCAPPLRQTLARGDYVRFVAPQGEHDIALTLFDDQRRVLLTIEGLSPHPPPSPDEELHWIAERAGEIQLEARVVPAGPKATCSPRRAAKRTATRSDLDRVEAETRLARAHALRGAGGAECTAALPLYEQAAAGFAALRLPGRKAEAHFGLGLVEQHCRRDAGAAAAAFERALPLYSEAGDSRSETQMRQRSGEIRFDRGELDAAVRHYRAALPLLQRSGDRHGEAAIANDLGHALHLLGRYDEAAPFFDRALALWSAIGELAGRATTLLNRGQLDRDLGEPQAARGRFQAALGLARRAGDKNLEGKAQNALGLMALGEGRPEEALAPLREALARRGEGSRGQAVTLATLGVAYSQLGRRDLARGAKREARVRFTDAWSAYRKALAIFEREQDSREQVKCLGNLGWLEAETDRLADARATFEGALARDSEAGDPPIRAWVLSGLAEVERRSGDLEAARRTMEGALSEIERQRSRQRETAIRAAFFSTQQEHYDFLVEILMEMHRRSPGAGHDAEALGIHERAQARSLLDVLARAGTIPLAGAEAELARRERELVRRIESLAAREQQMASEGASRTQRGPSVAERERLWREIERVRGELRAGRSRFAALTQPEPWSAEKIRRELLDRDTLLLEYRLGAERSFLWALSSEGLTSVPLPPRAEIEAAAGTASRLLGRSVRRKAEGSAAVKLAPLAATLLGPISSLLPGKRLLIVADGALRTLAFAALPDPNGGGPLVAGHEIVSLPSASMLGELRREVAGRRPATKTLWVLADPDVGGTLFPPLAYAGQEATALAALVPAAARSELSGPAARRETVLRAPLRDYRLLHFATHGSLAGDDAGGGRMVLAQRDGVGRRLPDGFLHLADIYGLDLRADLVTLSVCQSGLGTELRGEGLVGLTRGFFYAGAERVLVSLWNVNDRASVALIESFYTAMLRRGLSPAAALRAAQNAIRGQGRWRSPYYWAGFSLHGEWRGVRRDAKPARSPRDLAGRNGALPAPRRTR